jgi:hypothetical protein
MEVHYRLLIITDYLQTMHTLDKEGEFADARWKEAREFAGPNGVMEAMVRHIF